MSSSVKFLFKVLSSISLFFLIPTMVLAQEPDEVLREIINKIKSASNTSPVVDYVDWEKSFTTVPEARRQFMGVSSPSEMKDYYRKVLEDPMAMMKEQFQKRLETVPNAQKPALEQTFARMEKVMSEKTQEMQDRISNTDYEVGTPIIEGDNAKVPLKHTYQSEERNEEVEFELSDGKWLLPSVGMMGGQKPNSSNTQVKQKIEVK